MKKLASVIAHIFFVSCFIVTSFTQQNTTPPDLALGQISFRLQNPPQKVAFGSAVNSGNPGPATYYYWVVSNYTIGNSTPAGPFVITNGPNTLASGSGVTVSWRTASGANSYDLLRTSTSAMPTGACNCAVATAVTGASVTDQSNTLNAYTVSTLDPASQVVTVVNQGGGLVANGNPITGGNGLFNTVTVKGPRPWVDITAFGAIGDGVTDSTTAIQNAINFACSGGVMTLPPLNATCADLNPGEVFIPAGLYKTTACIQTYDSVAIIGTGMDSSVIQKSNNVNCTAGVIAAPARALNDNYAVDAILAVVHPTSDYAYFWSLRGVGLEQSGTSSTYGIYSPRASQFVVSDSYINKVGTGFYANDDWRGTIRNTTVDTANFGFRWANDGSGNGTGTTMTLDNVYAENIALSCYNIFGLQYSSFNNTACDNLNVANADNANIDLSYAAYGFNSSTNISLKGAGAEVIHGTVLSSQASVLSVEAMRALAVTGYTSAAGSPAYILVSSFGSVDLSGSTFDAMTSPGSFFNLLTQSGAMLTHRSTALPTGGSTFNSCSAGAAIVGINSGVITLTNGSACGTVTTIGPGSAAFGAGASFAGSVIPSVNGGFNSGGPGNAWLNAFEFSDHLIESTAPSSGGGQDICYGDSTAHAFECSYNAGPFLRMPQVIASGTAAMTTAAIAAGACGSTVTVAATGVLTTDVINVSHNAAVTSANGGILIPNWWPTAGNVNFNYCNPGAASQTPTAMTLNWSVGR